MDIPKFLDLAVELELQISALYTALADLSNDPPVARRMNLPAKEELKHAAILRSGKQYYDAMPDLFVGIALEESELVNGVREIKSYILSLKKRNVLFVNNLKKLLELERKFERIHLGASVQVKDPTLKGLFINLSNGDNIHIGTLKVLIDSYGG